MSTKIQRPSIVWQKWQDPFAGDNDVYTTPDDLIQQPEFINDIDIDPKNNYTEEYSEEENPKEIFKKKHIKAIITPLGIIPYDDYNNAGSIFNFWIGHTNFDLSPNVVTIIEANEGVEILDIYTRYRFRIGIGQLFNSGDVMSAINHSVYRYLDGEI